MAIRSTRSSKRSKDSPTTLPSPTHQTKCSKPSTNYHPHHVSRYDYHARLRQKIETELHSGCLPYQALPGLNKVINMATLTPFEQEFFLMLAPTPLQDPYVLQKAVTGKQEKKVYRPRRKKVIEMEKMKRDREVRREEERRMSLGGFGNCSQSPERIVESVEEDVDVWEGSGHEGEEIFGYVADNEDFVPGEVRVDELFCEEIREVSEDVVSEDVVASIPPWIANLGLI